MHGTDKYSRTAQSFRPVWLNGWVFVYELSGCGFESSCNPRNGLDDTAITTVAKYSINFTEQQKGTSLHYNASNRFSFVNEV